MNKIFLAKVSISIEGQAKPTRMNVWFTHYDSAWQFKDQLEKKHSNVKVFVTNETQHTSANSALKAYDAWLRGEEAPQQDEAA
jgi:hypothetical protein